MKGIILAGGTGSRLYPLTKVTNKHLLPVGELPMILHAVKKMTDVEITDIMIVTGTEHMGDMVSLLGSGNAHGCDFTYKIQDQPDGIAGALLLCEEFVGDDDCLVILGDNIFQDSLHDIVENFYSLKKKRQMSLTCALALKKVPDPQRFGVAEINNGTITSIEEKPLDPKSDLCITGIYAYDSGVFDMIKELKKSNRGEYEITDVNNSYVIAGCVTFTEFKGWWSDAGTHESYHLANVLAHKGQPVLK